MKLMKSFNKHKNIHTYTWSAHNSKTIIGYCITVNSKLSELFPDVRVHR